jgi:hypothetical protein
MANVAAGSPPPVRAGLSPGPINTIPQGLLGLLQLKQLGRNPDQLSPVVAPHLELFPFYQARLETDLVVPGSDLINLPTATPGMTYFTTVVPNTQTWWIQRITAAGTLLAAESVIFALVTRVSGTGVGHLVSGYFADVVTARARAFRITGGGFWAVPGTSFGIQVADDVTAATITFQLGIRGFAVPL